MKTQTWTVYFNAFCHGHKSPYNRIAIQATRGMADDVLRYGLGLDPFETDCVEHGSGWWVTENVEDPQVYVHMSSHESLFVIRADAVPYYAQKIWKEPIWKEVNG